MGYESRRTMNIGSGIAFGLVAALCWGVADFCARGSSRTGGTFLTLFYVEIIATFGLLLLALPLGLISFAHATPGIVALAILINLAILGGAALLYRAFAIGTLSLVSPIAASFAAITALLSLLTGERANPLQLVGIVLTVAGVTLASTVPASAAASAEKPARNAQLCQRSRAAGARTHRGARRDAGLWRLLLGVALSRGDSWRHDHRLYLQSRRHGRADAHCAGGAAVSQPAQSGKSRGGRVARRGTSFAGQRVHSGCGLSRSRCSIPPPMSPITWASLSRSSPSSRSSRRSSAR